MYENLLISRDILFYRGDGTVGGTFDGFVEDRFKSVGVVTSYQEAMVKSGE